MSSGALQHASVAASPLREPLSWFASLVGLLILVPAAIWLLPWLVLLSIGIVAISLWMMHRLIGLFNLKRVTIPAFFYFLYLSVILTPGFFIFQGEVTPSRWRFLFGIESVLIALPLGVWLAIVFLGGGKQRVEAFFSRPVDAEPLGPQAARLFWVFLVCAAALIAINLEQMPAIPLLYLIRNPGEFLTAALLREGSFKLLHSHLIYAYYVLRGTIFPFLILAAYGRYRQHGGKTWSRLFWISLGLGVLYASLTIEKSPVAAIFGILFVFSYLFRGGRLGRTTSIAAPALFLSFPLAIVLLAYHGTNGGTVTGAIQAIGQRLFYSPAQIVYAYFEIFPSIIPFQHGATITTLAGLLGAKTMDIPNAVGMYMNSGADLDTITANACFIGNLNADFGLPGVVIGAIVAGFLMQALSAYFYTKRKTVVALAAYAICMWAFGMLVTTPLPMTLLSGGVAFALVLCWIFENDGRRPVIARRNVFGKPA